MGQGNINRVPRERLAAVRKRLAEVRGDVSLDKTKDMVAEASVELGLGPKSKGFACYHSDVGKWEGREKGRDTSPPVEYVEAFAHAFREGRVAREKGWQEAELRDYLLATDVLTFSEEQVRGAWERRRRAFRAQVRGEPPTDELFLLRERVRYLLGASALLPDLQDGDRMSRDPVLWIIDDLERLFWSAFKDRGLPPADLLRCAIELGRAIPTPPRLPGARSQGESRAFALFSELDPAELRRWWLHQSEALRTLLRPSTFDPDDLALGRFGEEGYPVPWNEWAEAWDNAEERKEEELINTVLAWTAADFREPGSGVHERAPGRAPATGPKEDPDYMSITLRDGEVIVVHRDARLEAELEALLEALARERVVMTFTTRDGRDRDLSPSDVEYLDVSVGVSRAGKAKRLPKDPPSRQRGKGPKNTRGK